MPLRIKSLELHGYKTFAERTLFEFAGGITAIVGPNGSGKSNIADALRWVLGEQSYSLLRAKRTEDMIFSGSEQRARAGMASVTVLFDNSDNWLPLEFAEVTLARRAYRDGRNEYLLNNQIVRLRDIRELLARSGLSERTYTILGQGLVDAALALRADERRKLFEEAAGVGLYRARREEALRRLEATQRNLERVQDIMAELEPRLRTLERQARKAREYAQAQADLRLLLREWYGYHWHRAQKELAAARETAREQERQLQEARQAYRESQEAYRAFREHLQTLRRQLNAWREEHAELQKRREETQRSLAVLEERRRALTAAHHENLIAQERAHGEGQAARERLRAAEAETHRLQEEYDEAEKETARAQAALQSLQKRRQEIEQALQAAEQALAAARAEQAELRARRDELRSRIAGQEERLAAIEETLTHLEETLHQAEARHKEAIAARQEAGNAVQKARQTLETRREKVAALEEKLRAAREKGARLEREKAHAQSQLEVIEQAEQVFIGYAQGARLLLEAAREARLHGTHGALSAALDVPAELEIAIAAALGDYLDAILLDSERAVEEALNLLLDDQSGRAALLPLERIAPPHPASPPQDADCLGTASELVTTKPELRPAVTLLLGQTLIVRDRRAARRLMRTAAPPLKAVTLRGEIFHADGRVVAGPKRHAGTLSRPRQRREWQAALERATRDLSALEKTIRQLEEDLASATREADAAQATLHQAQEILEKAQAEERNAALEVESVRRQRAWQQEQQKLAQAEVETAQAEKAQIEARQAGVEERFERARDEMKRLREALTALELEEAQAQVTYWKTRLAVAGRALEDARARMAERQQAMQEAEARAQDLVERQKALEQSLVSLDEKEKTLRAQEQEVQGLLETLQARIAPIESELAGEEESREYQQAEESAQQTLARAERMYTQAQLHLARSQERLDTLRRRIEDDFGLVQFDYASDIAGPVPLPFDGMVEELPVVTELPPNMEEHLKQQRAHLRRLGPINPEAEQEYAAERERYDFLSEQVSDLRKAESDLRQVIAELDDLTQREFRKTFDAVAKEFREIFVRLFGGGSARLVLTDPDNLIETGIDIEARLPGRREQGLALLSGGERSLTAIALVFALLKVSPPPLCVLDEVDAMLDEANVVRFRELLKELSRETQFLIITHNRNTVQAADVIYGVTMGRDSTSQVISLKLDELSDEVLDTYTH